MKTEKKERKEKTEEKKQTEEKKAPRPANVSPYQLDKTQTLKAARALLKHLAAEATSSDKPNLLNDPEDPTESAAPIWLVLTAKKYITDTRKLKPSRVELPFPLKNPSNTTVCLIVKDPQRHYKDLVATAGLQDIVTKVVGIGKLEKKFKSFESRRQLMGSHEIFIADQRVIPKLPTVLGTTFLRRTAKIPLPIALDSSETPAGFKAKVEKTIRSTYVHLSPAASTNIRVGLSSMTPEQVVDNVAQVMDTMTLKALPGGWRNVRSLFIKSPNSASLPIYMAAELYGDEDVLKPEEEQQRLLAMAEKAAERKERKQAKNAKRKGLSETKPVDEEKAAEEEGQAPKKKTKVSAEEKK
ncbi:ribosomal protein L1p/L10e family-domain-containing protein [Sphaerosporella brunnea]|uniref:Ribosomal protein L1p/L10e family-domain-containing protein n=1 Tax=Sphaerosporella brunnea TaxID=1250544 RepID=A0A5J5EE92_9PEZI|nr:ribosomal protein L1p/L10e family-domain-containing protein [Sphaerosporella brunnea]